jgi:probable rRNA maturation factor
MAELNHAYRGVTGPTDVLAFPMGEGRLRGISPDLLGDVVISAETAARQARARQVDVQGELALLLVHGILHLVGYDHGTAGTRRRMWRKQQAILEACGLRPEGSRVRPAAASATRAGSDGGRRKA